MRTRNAIPFVALCAVVALGAVRRPGKAGGEKAQEQQQTDQPLPPPVQATVDQQLPGSTVTGYEREADEGRQLFFVDVTTSDKKNLTVLIAGKGQYLGQVIDNDEDDGDVFVDPTTAPDGVKKGIAKYYKVDDLSKAELDNLFMEVEQSRFIFIAERTKNKVTEWVSFSYKGDFVAVETEVDLKDLPAPVKDAVTKAHPNGKLTSASVTDEKEKKKKFYTIEVTDGASKLEVTASPDGQVESTEPAEDDATKPG